MCNRDRLDTLKRRLEEVTGLVVDSDKKIEVAKTHKIKASDIFEKARRIIDNARETKDKAKDPLNTEGSRYLKKAKDQHKKFGEESEKMSQIAREAMNFGQSFMGGATSGPPGNVEVATEAVAYTKQKENVVLDPTQTVY